MNNQEQLHARLISALDKLMSLGFNQQTAFWAIGYKGKDLPSKMKLGKISTTERAVIGLENLIDKTLGKPKILKRKLK
jgi:hypothetical protein